MPAVPPIIETSIENPKLKNICAINIPAKKTISICNTLFIIFGGPTRTRT